MDEQLTDLLKEIEICMDKEDYTDGFNLKIQSAIVCALGEILVRLQDLEKKKGE